MMPVSAHHETGASGVPSCPIRSKTVTLPLSVYNHINSMQVPAPVTVQDFTTGQMKTDFSHKRARFTATLTEKGIASLQSMVSAPARKTKEASQ